MSKFQIGDRIIVTAEHCELGAEGIVHKLSLSMGLVEVIYDLPNDYNDQKPHTINEANIDHAPENEIDTFRMRKPK